MDIDMPRPTLSGVWTEVLVGKDNQYPKLQIWKDETLIAEMHYDEEVKWAEQFSYDMGCLHQDKKEKRMAYERNLEYERRYGKD